MDTHELLNRIIGLPIVSDSLAENMLAGNFRSVFKGQGMEFDEARHYQWGDDARSIDWNASARLGTPFVKMFREERELTILLMLDTSASMHRGIANLWGGRQIERNGQMVTPFEQALLAAALIAFSAERNGQRVGAFLFDREIDCVFLPRKGRRNILAFVSGALQCHRTSGTRTGGAANRSLLTRAAEAGAKAGSVNRQKPRSGHTSNLRSAITGAGRLLKRRSMVVLLSDFQSTGWEHELGVLSSRHDVIAIRISDLIDSHIPNLGLVTFRDPETGAQLTAPTGSASFRDAWFQWHTDRANLWLKLCRRSGAAYLELPVDTDAAAALVRFFGGRGGR